MATFTEAQASFGFYGYFDMASAAGFRCWQKDDCSWTGYITGTACTMAAHQSGGASPFWVSVDGGAESQLTISAGAVTLFTGLTDTAHLVKIRGDAGYTPTFAQTPTSGTLFTVTGAAPAIGQGSDLGTAYLFNDPSFPGKHSFYLGAAPSGNITPTAKYLTRTILSNAGSYANGGAVMFKAQCTDIWIHSAYQDFFYSIDGGAWTEVTTAQASANVKQWRKILTGLDGAAPHTYIISPSLRDTDISTTITFTNSGVMVGGPSATFSSVGSPKRLMQFGDSITHGGNTTYYSGAVDVYQYSGVLGFMPHCAGKAGQTAAGLNTDLSTILAGQVATPDYAVLAIGRNDTSGAAFRTSYKAIIDALIAAGVQKVMCRKIVPDQALAFDANLDTDIQTVVSGYSSAVVKYMGDDTWINIATYETPPYSGTHPTVAGYVTLSGYEVAPLRSFLSSPSRSARLLWILRKL